MPRSDVDVNLYMPFHEVDDGDLKILSQVLWDLWGTFLLAVLQVVGQNAPKLLPAW